MQIELKANDFSELKELANTLKNRRRFHSEWAIKVQRKAKLNAHSKGGRDFWHSVVAPSVKISRFSDSGATIEVDNYIAVHKHFGGIIRPKNSNYLTIPIAEEAKGKRAAEFTGEQSLFLVPSKPSSFLAYDDDSELKFMYVLKNEVHQTAEPWFPSEREILNIGEKIIKKYI